MYGARSTASSSEARSISGTMKFSPNAAGPPRARPAPVRSRPAAAQARDTCHARQPPRRRAAATASRRRFPSAPAESAARSAATHIRDSPSVNTTPEWRSRRLGGDRRSQQLYIAPRITAARRSTAVSSSASVRWLNDSRMVLRAAVADVERRARDVGHAAPRWRPGAWRACRAASRQRQPGEEAARSARSSATPSGMWRVSAADSARPVRRVQRAGGREVALEVPGAAVLLEQALPERRPRTGRCSAWRPRAAATTSRGPAAQPSRTPGKKTLRERAGLQHDVGRERPQRRQRGRRRRTARGRRRPRRSARRGGGRARPARGAARAAASGRSGSGTPGSCRGTSGAGRPPGARRARRRAARRRPSRSATTLGLGAGEGHQRARGSSAPRRRPCRPDRSAPGT